MVARREADVKSNIPKFVSVSDDAIVGVYCLHWIKTYAIFSVFLVVIAARGQTPASGGTATTGLTVKRTKIGNVYI